MFYKKGTKVNPLDYNFFHNSWIFIDGNDPKQVDWLKEDQLDGNKLILINGSPIKLSEQLEMPVFFDQLGVITTKLNINAVPAIVTRSKDKLKIEEICLDC